MTVLKSKLQEILDDFVENLNNNNILNSKINYFQNTYCISVSLTQESILERIPLGHKYYFLCSKIIY